MAVPLLALPTPPAQSAPFDRVSALPRQAVFLRILGVNYAHLRTADEGDLYVTEHGLPLLSHLQPENWYESEWFTTHRERLVGTSAVYRVPTRPQPHPPRSIDLVVKWSRVGQDVPLNTFTLNKAINAEFNTPFEEFSLLEELRAGEYGPSSLQILTQKPLAIYVPPERLQLWQTGRSKDKIVSKIARHPGVEIDILRSYILLYGWIRGYDAIEAYKNTYLNETRQREELLALTQAVDKDLEKKGFMVADHKSAHVIVRLKDGQLKRRRDGSVTYAVIDYELLARTPAHDEAVKRWGRSRYLALQRDRFQRRPPDIYPAHLTPSEIAGVPFVWGRTESTGGSLWVVGNDPELFSYFLPERWRMRQIVLSHNNRTYYTQTKDRIHLVWKVSRVGELPEGDFNSPSYEARLTYGFNSPFEEFALALEMQRRGLPVTYPRAIYMTGHDSPPVGCITDERRYELLRKERSPDGSPALRLDRDYITIWGYWRGLEDDEAPSEKNYWNPIDAGRAEVLGILGDESVESILERQRRTLAEAGFEDLDLRPDHILLSHIPGGAVRRDKEGRIALRQCNFEMVRKIG